MSFAGQHRLSAAEYLDLEVSSAEKHMFFDGEVFEMGRNSLAHALVFGNLVRKLGARLRGTPCRVVSNDLRINVAQSSL